MTRDTMAMLVWGAGFILGLTACGNRDAAESLRFQQEREQAKRDRKAFMKRLVTGQESEEAIRLVQNSPEPKTGLTYKEWAERRLDDLAGDVLFPGWEAVRTSPTTYEIWFSYTYLDRENRLFNNGYAWRADLMMRTIDPPRKLSEDELAARGETASGRARPPRSIRDVPELE